MVITFAGALRQALAYRVHLNAELFTTLMARMLLLLAETLNTIEPLLTVAVAWSRVVSTSKAIFFSSSQVTFIYIALLTIQIVSKQLHNIKIGK